MAAIPPMHEDPPVGTNTFSSTGGPPDHGPGAEESRGQAAAPGGEPVPQSPNLPADWSPVDPAPPDDPPR